MPTDIALRLGLHFSMHPLLPSHRTLSPLPLPPLIPSKYHTLLSSFSPADCRKAGKSLRLQLKSVKSSGIHELETTRVRSDDAECDQNLLEEIEGGQEEEEGRYGKGNEIVDEGVEARRMPADRWMGVFVCDIVRNIEEAPFLHMLFLSEDAAALSERHKVPSGRGKEEGWEEYVRDCVSGASPDGVILVHQLDLEGGCVEGGHSHGRCGTTDRFWGVLVLGKSISKSACYILKTTTTTSSSSFSSSSSMGTCTAYCLTKAKCFGPSWYNQMESCWLLGGETKGN